MASRQAEGMPNNIWRSEGKGHFPLQYLLSGELGPAADLFYK